MIDTSGIFFSCSGYLFQSQLINSGLLFPNEEMPEKRFSWFMIFCSCSIKQNGSSYNALFYGDFECNDMSNG